jgi:hypothetical protein
MRLSRRSRWKRGAGLLVAGAALGLVADGTLVGAQTGGNVIYACVFDNPTGPNTRIVAETELPCPERSVRKSWSVQGPAGAAGPQGPPGPKGPKGPASGGLAYGASKSAQQQIPKGGSVDLKLPLEKGRYFLTAKASLQTDNVKCKLLRDGNASALDAGSVGSDERLAATVSVQRLHMLTGPGRVRLRCFNQSNELTFVFDRRITAIQLDGYLQLGS